MKDYLILKILTFFGSSIIVFNLFFHIFNIEQFISLGPSNSVMTIYTSLSLALFYYARRISKQSFSLFALSMACIVQLVSLFFLYNNIKPAHLYFVSSSVPTSLFIIGSSLILFTFKLKDLSIKFQHYAGLFLLTCTTILLFAFITENLSILGFQKGFSGVGVNVYTLASFFMISVMFLLSDAKIASLDSVNISFTPIKAMAFLFVYSMINFLLLFCPGKSIFLVGLVTQVIFLVLSYNFFLRPFIRYGNDSITICSWSHKIKTKDGKWINQEDHFTKLGMNVNHGLSTEEFNKLKTG